MEDIPIKTPNMNAHIWVFQFATKIISLLLFRDAYRESVVLGYKSIMSLEQKK